MSFLQPALLLALPVIALPIVIHLINQRRFQTVPWAAMQFLLAANRMSRGYARIRQWLILAARTLAVAGLIFAVSRPLSSGWLGLAGGGQVDTTLILLDRSPSMSQIGSAGVSKLQSGTAQLARSLSMLDSKRCVLIDSVTMTPREIGSPDQLPELTESTPVSETADIPAMLELAAEYIQANRPSRCEIWICSDVRRSDWQDESGRWAAIRASMIERSQLIRFHLLAYPEQATSNRSVEVTEVKRVDGDASPRLLLSLRIEQDGEPIGPASIPIGLELDGARSEFTVEMTAAVLELKDHAIPLPASQTRGWGRVSIPADECPADNEYYFVYDQQQPRRTLIVADDPDAVHPLELATGISPDPEIRLSASTVAPEQLVGQTLDDVSLLLWQARLPSLAESESSSIAEFLQRGGRAIFFPPATPDDGTLAGIRWGAWQQTDGLRIATWMGDQDLLENTRSGGALPLGELTVNRYCTLEGDRTNLATLDGGAPLLARAMTDQRNVYFCATSVAPGDSSLATGGVALYAMLQRALAAGAETLGNTRQYIAGAAPNADSGNWQQLAGSADALSINYPVQAGVYQQGDQLLAINRSSNEDAVTIVPDDRVEALFEGLDFDRVDDRAGEGSLLIREIWRLFLFLMLIALLVEATLCIPRRPLPQPEGAKP